MIVSYDSHRLFMVRVVPVVYSFGFSLEPLLNLWPFFLKLVSAQLITGVGEEQFHLVDLLSDV